MTRTDKTGSQQWTAGSSLLGLVAQRFISLRPETRDVATRDDANITIEW